MRERRKHPRVPFNALVTFLTAQSDRPRLCKGVDLSMGGARMRSFGDPPAIEQLVECELLVDEHTSLRLDGEILRVDGDTGDVALRFMNLTPQTRSILQELIGELGQRAEAHSAPGRSAELTVQGGVDTEAAVQTDPDVPPREASRVFSIAPAAPSVVEASLSGTAFRLLCLVDGRHTCAELADAAGLPLKETSKQLRALAERGFIIERSEV